MKGRLTTRQATLKLNRDEFMHLFCHLRDTEEYLRQKANDEERDLTTIEQSICTLSQMCLCMYGTEKTIER